MVLASRGMWVPRPLRRTFEVLRFMSTSPINSTLRPVVSTPDSAAPAAPAKPVVSNTVAQNRPADAFAGSVQPAVVNLGVAKATPRPQAPIHPQTTIIDAGSAEAKAAQKATEAAIPSQLPQLAGDTFTINNVAKDEFGTTHIRLDRSHNGLPVYGEQAVGHVAADGSVKVTGLVGQIPADLGKGKPPMTADAAAKKIIQQFGLNPGDVTAKDMTRCITQGLDGKYRDTWMIEGYFAGASKGQVSALVTEDGKLEAWSGDAGILSANDIKRAKEAVAEQAAQPAVLGRKKPTTDPTPTGSGNDHTEYSGTVEIGGTDAGGGKQQMLDQTRGQGIETNDAEGRTEDKEDPKTLTDNNGAWGEATDPKGQQTAVDAQYGAEMTYDFYKDVLGRNSIDGQGEKLTSTVNVRLEDGSGTLTPNAFWNGEKMTYGVGDGKEFGDLTELDIAGHEISHGMSERTAGLIYRNESGGINESMSDIMGTGVEWYASQHNPSVKFNFDIGENAFTPGKAGDALRYMDDPTKDGYSLDHYSQMKKFPADDGIGPDRNDNGGVHGSSGIMNNAFYLMSQGGKNHTSKLGVDSPIGIESSLKIFGRALQFYMTPNSTFASTRDATIMAATDLYGANSKEVAAVKQAWTAVGVESKPAVA